MMSEIAEIWNLDALCRCCHSDGYFKSLSDSYVYENETEIYSKMLRDAINVEISPPLVEASYTICDVCITRLRDALKFKEQVLLCERKFEEYCKNELVSRSPNDCVKVEYDNADDHDDDFPEAAGGSSPSFDIKYDVLITKKEEVDFDRSCFIELEEIKNEDDNKSQIKLSIPKIEKKGVSKTTQKRKRDGNKVRTVRKPTKTYDSSLEVLVKTDTGVLYSCLACGGRYSEQKALKQHVLEAHSAGKYKCPHCCERFTESAKRLEHLRTHQECAVKCQHCDKVFYTNKALKEHENVHSRTKDYKCDLCLKEFTYKATLQMHLRGHYGTKRRCICHLCGHGFNDIANLRAHILTVHEKQRPFPCELCPKSFTAKKHLKSHMMRHLGGPGHACSHCPKQFYCASELKHHMLSHLENRYTCKVCRRRFAERSAFLKHLRRSHVGQRPFKCNVCDKDFVCKYSMRRHVAEHSSDRPYQCTSCDAKFKQKGALNRHTDRKHGLPKETATEKCEICNKLVADLKKHMLCHNNKRFVCEYCDKSYSENNVLTRHKRVVHFGIKPHVCEYCDKKYVKVNSLRNHQLKVHKVVSKVETDEDFDSAVAKFSIKNKKSKVKSEGVLGEDVGGFT